MTATARPAQPTLDADHQCRLDEITGVARRMHPEIKSITTNAVLQDLMRNTGYPARDAVDIVHINFVEGGQIKGSRCANR